VKLEDEKQQNNNNETPQHRQQLGILQTGHRMAAHSNCNFVNAYLENA
jgi:hypothetical protein